MRKFTIKRHNDGKFYIEVLMGHGAAKQLYQYDLDHDVKKSCLLFKKKVQNIRVEELSQEKREELLKSISLDIKCDEPYAIETSRGMIKHPFYPQASLGESQPTSFNIKIPGCQYVGY